MTLRQEARAAHDAASVEHESTAREVLAEVLAPYDPAELQVAAAEAHKRDRWRLVVFTDSDVHLGVHEAEGRDPEVHLLDSRRRGDGWQRLAQVESLAHLGELLPVHDPADTKGA